MTNVGESLIHLPKISGHECLDVGILLLNSALTNVALLAEIRHQMANVVV